MGSILRNLLLITLGSIIVGLGLKAVALPQGFITGGISGLGFLLYYATDWMTPGIWYFIINLPIFIIGWVFVSRRFFLYSLYGMVALSLSIDLINLQIPIHDPILAVLAAGTIIGTGAGITLHSLGSQGGTDIIAIILHQKFSVRIGSVYLIFNLVLFACSFGFLRLDLVLYSFALTFVISNVLDYVITIFNQRKMVLIISNSADDIADAISTRLKRGLTFISGVGAFTKQPKTIILTVVHNHQLKRLEEIIFTSDPAAFMITGNTFNVLGQGFSKRKIY
jgi:uncharacterized membrane-anchored protein YitT (DUF2179 family)